MPWRRMSTGHLQTMRKKLFLLREESPAGPARIEYYNDKKLKPGSIPKRTIIISTCFSITKKSDAKHKWAIALFTKDDCFSLVCDSEEEQTDWLEALLEQQKLSYGDSDAPRQHFEHIWQVTVKPRGLANGRNLTSGPFRLCLTNKTLSLVRKNQEEPDIVFPLAGIRRCGHTHCFFFMEVGRSSTTGEGEIWMEVEDVVIAQNMHEVILSSMKSSRAYSDQPNFRPRSRSSASDRSGGKTALSRGTSPGYDSGSATLPKRSKTIGSYEHPTSSPPTSRLRPGSSKSGSSRSSVTSLGRGHSPITSSPLSHALLESHRTRTDSMESRGTVSSLSADELDLSPMEPTAASGLSSARSATPDGLDPVQEDAFLRGNLMASPSSQLISQCETYMDMMPGQEELPEAYMNMSPGTPAGESSYLDMTPVSYSSSPAASTSSRDADDHGYLDMAPMAHSLPTVEEKNNDAGYLDMSPGNRSILRSTPKLRPDKVYSYLSDESSFDEFPKRAYSVGSKPTPSATAGYMDMTVNEGSLDKAKKSNSAPHLVDKDKNHGSRTSLTDSSGKPSRGTRKETQPELFMEMDFNKDDSPIRPRTASGGRDIREQRLRNVQYSEQDAIRARTSSFGREGAGIARTMSMNRPDPQRPRTATICQDFRNRTSSFGSSDMRPRSSSYGNSRFRRRTSQESSRHSSNESLRRVAHRTSQESLRSNASSEYLDMSHKPHVMPSRSKPSPAESAYMSMEPEASKVPPRGDTDSRHHLRTRAAHLRVASSDSSSSQSSSPGAPSHLSDDTVHRPYLSSAGTSQRGPQIDDSYAVFTPVSAVVTTKPPPTPPPGTLHVSFSDKKASPVKTPDAKSPYLNIDFHAGEKAGPGTVIKPALPPPPIVKHQEPSPPQSPSKDHKLQTPVTSVSEKHKLSSVESSVPDRQKSPSPVTSVTEKHILGAVENVRDRQKSPSPVTSVSGKQKLGPVPHPSSPRRSSPNGNVSPYRARSPNHSVCAVPQHESIKEAPTSPVTPVFSIVPPAAPSGSEGAYADMTIGGAEAAVESPYADMTIGAASPQDSPSLQTASRLGMHRNHSQGSLATPHELHYASLDLSSSMEDLKVSERSTHSPLGMRSGGSQGEVNPPLMYAKIDFAKSENIRQGKPFSKYDSLQTSLSKATSSDSIKSSSSVGAKSDASPSKREPQGPAPFDLKRETDVPAPFDLS